MCSYLFPNCLKDYLDVVKRSIQMVLLLPYCIPVIYIHHKNDAYLLVQNCTIKYYCNKDCLILVLRKRNNFVTLTESSPNNPFIPQSLQSEVLTCISLKWDDTTKGMTVIKSIETRGNFEIIISSAHLYLRIKRCSYDNLIKLF